MLDPTSDAKPMNYAQADENSRLLWRSQRKKVDPWEHRTQQEPDAEAEPPEASPAAAEPATVIAQRDELTLHEAQEVENPFVSLLENRLNIELPGHE